MGDPQSMNQFDDLLRSELNGFAPEPPPGLFSAIEQTVGSPAAQNIAGSSKTAFFSKGLLKILALTTGLATIAFVAVQLNTPADSIPLTTEQNPIAKDQKIDMVSAPNTDQEVVKSESSSSIEPKTSSIKGSQIVEPIKSNESYSSNRNETTTNNSSQTNPVANQPEKIRGIAPVVSHPVQNHEPSGKTDLSETPEANFSYEWIDSGKLRLINNSKNTQKVNWLLNGKVTDQKFEDETVIQINRDNWIHHITIVATHGNIVDSSTQKIRYYSDDHVKMPNTFTPNNDGQNDTYKIITLFPTSFTRIQIYSADGFNLLNTVESEWDGNINGIPAPTGIYQITFSCKTPDSDQVKVLKQTIQLFR